MFEQIPNCELRVADMPPAEAQWHEIESFAFTYWAYDYHGGFDAVGELANAAGAAYAEDGTLPDTLAELRTCLFFEQRRYHHFGWSPEGHAMEYIRALLEAIRGKVAVGEWD